MKEYYVPGDHWLLCDQCQRKMRFSESGKRWDGLIVHRNPDEGCWETRHPQDFVRPVRDNIRPAVVRPDNEGIEATLAIHCASLTHRFFDRQDFEVDITVYKARVQGPIPVEQTTTIICELEVY